MKSLPLLLLLAAILWGATSPTRAGEQPNDCWEFIAMKNYLVIIDTCNNGAPSIRRAHLREIPEMTGPHLERLR